MGIPTISKIATTVCLFFISFTSFAQSFEPFEPRFNEDLRGDIVLIGNNILGPSNNAFNDNDAYNSNEDMQYIDIDGDNSTFSSSSADLVIPNPDCYAIRYAGLYWGAVNPGNESITDVKIKGPTGGYVDVTGTIIHEAGTNSVDGGNSFSYACYADVTSIVQGLASNLGTYTIANVSSDEGETSDFGNGTGHSAGWSLFVVYEDPTLPGKSITSFDGFSSINTPNNSSLDIPVTGFRTVPAPAPVRANFAFAALEGDKRISGDRLGINFWALSAPDRPSNNFFNSTISQLSGLPVNNRVPNSTNTLGFDTGILEVPNPSNNVINNDATSAVINLRTTGDTYFPYFFAFAVEIIEPDIILTKLVENDAGDDIGGEVVGLGQSLNYVIGFQNVGNDNATNFQIKDILPINIVFNYPGDLVLPPGVTVASYDPITRELILDVADYLVEQNDPVYEIRIEVETVATCADLEDACSNIINNQAFATYNGYDNPTFQITDDPSLNSNTGCLLVPQATNFLADLDDCNFTQNEILCGSSLEMTAAGGYDSYSWSTSPTGTPVIGTSQSITVTETGTYYVFNTAIAPCQSIQQEFIVELYGGDVENPVIPYADEVVTCPNDGELLPNIYLCGANDSREIQTNIPDSTTLTWELLDETSCPVVLNTDCANENAGCVWNEVFTGPNYIADTSGQYRLTINYPGGCFVQFYFNVYQNLLDPTVEASDIICTSPGSITVNNVPTGYEYSLDGTTYQTSNVFTVTTPGIYTVYVRQMNIATNPCVFTVPNIQIRERDFTVSTTVIQPLCHDDLGSIQLAANDVEPQYSYEIFQNGTLVNSVGPIQENTYIFANLNPGTYTVTVTTDDGCTHSEELTIIQPELLTVTAALTTPLTCTDGEITIYPVGGTPPYTYFINSSTEFQTVPEVVVINSGVFDITIVDYNNCSVSTTVTVDDLPEPEYTVTHTDILCYNDNTGVIEFDVTDANGYTLEYSIDNGTTFSSNATFSNLGAGDYEVLIKYSLSGSECFTTAQTVTISQPDDALTATAGVSELAGCGPSGEGTIRITNPQGGTPFPAPNYYEYSFDNQATWTTNNEAYVTPGTYTVYVRDANGCIYAMPNVVLDQEPPAPTISLSDTEFNCDGSGNATVTITNNGGDSYSYDYYIDGVLNPNTENPEIFTNVPSGSHTISVEYTLLSVPTFSNLLYETFGYGEDTTSPGINPVYYCFERQVVATQCNGNPAINDGDYSVTSNIEHPFGSWVNPTDYTPATTPPTPDGRYLVVNIGATIPASEVLYEKDIIDIIPNQPIQVEFAAINLLKTGNTQYDPNLRVALVDASGTEISFYNTGDIPKTEDWIEYPLTPITLDPGANTSLKFILRSNVQQTSGNDVAIDDLKVYQLPVACTTLVEFPFVVPSGHAFTADVTGTTMVSCAGASDGSITIAAENFNTTNGYQYSIDNGVTWVTQMTSPYTITGLTDGNYDIQVRYDDAVDTCSFSFTETISVPDALTISLDQTDATCVDGATITATSTGGTPSYSYQLIDTVAPFTATDFESSGIITNVSAGSYTVEVTDANGCTESTTITIDEPLLPTASIDVNSDLCYDSIDAATIEVTVTSGQAPYQFSNNGGAFQSSNIFENLVPGTYTIVVRDSYGCEVTLPAQTIEPELTLSAVITKDLDCTTSPDAVITGTFSGGSAPYTYQVSVDGVAYIDLGITGSPFTYTTDTPGTYQFEIIDALGCSVTSLVNTIDAITLPTATAIATDPLCFDESNGQVQLTATGGSGGYTFSFNGSPFTATSLYDGLNANTTTATTTEYTYQIQDSNSCLSPVYTITLNNPTELVASATLSDNTTCSATSEITVTATGGTAGYVYSFNGNTSYTSSNVLTVNNTATTQTITYSVRDDNGCIITQTIDVPPFDPLTGMTFTNSNGITCNDTTTDVTVTPNNGVGPFTFEITAPATATSNTTGETTGVFTGLTPGDYTFTISDSNGCEITGSHVIAPATTIAASGSSTDQTCFGSDNGTATFTMTDVSAVGNYTYTLTPSAGTATQTGNSVTVTNLPVGSYTLNVEDTTTGCTTSATVTIAAATPINFTANASNVSCNNAISTISFPSLSGGAGGYTYAYVTNGSPAPTSGDFGTSTTVDTGVLGLVIDVYVMDSNDCVVMDTVTIIADPAPTVTASVDNQCTGNGSNFTINVTATGVATLTYSIDGTTFQTGNTFTVVAGTYTITVKDGNGCQVTDTVTVSPQLTLAANLDKDITCSLPADAQVTLTATGGDATTYTYAYSTDGGATFTTMASNVFNTATPGSYIFMVTDANSCSTQTTLPIEITPAVNPDITVVQTGFINCNGEETGAISITPDTTLGQAPYSYEVFNTTTSTSYGTQTSGLPAGDYTVTVTDARGCTEVETITISQPDPILVTHHAVDISCDSTTSTTLGSVIVDSVTGGVGPYNYYVTGTNGYSDFELNNTGTTSTTFDVVDFGLYQINVVDANGCSVLIQDVLVASPPDDLDIIINSTANCTTGGEATVSIGTTLASTGPFYFAIYDGTIPASAPVPPAGGWQVETTPGSGSTVFTPLTPGMLYTFIVYDVSTGCYYFESATDPIPTSATLTATAVSSNNITCTGSADGNVTFTINNPESTPIDVQFEIYNSLSLDPTGNMGTSTVPAGGSITITELGTLDFGNYFVLITETSGTNAGCSIVTAPFNITESAIDFNLAASVTLNENCNDLGVISAVGSDGTAPYQYQILLASDPTPVATSPGWATPNTFTVPADVYTVYAMDAYGCIREVDVTLTKDAEPIIDPQTAPCYDGNPIPVTITGSVSIGTPLYSINGTTFVSNPNFTISTPGTHTLYIQDGNGCVASTPFVVNSQLVLSANLTNGLDCTVTPDAEITLTASGGDTTSYTYEVSTDGGTTYTPMATNVYTATTAGSYMFSVTDAQGCETTTTYVLDPIPTTTFTTSQTDVSCNGGSDGTITITTTSATGPFTYQLDAGTPQTSNVFTGLAQGTYTVTVIDAYECTVSNGPITINEPVLLTATDSISTNTTCDIATVITVTASGGTSPYSYNFNGTGYSTSNTFTVNNNGAVQTVNYGVKDANGCLFSGSVMIDPLDPPTDLEFTSTPITCLVSTSDVTLTTTGGVGTLSYEILAPASATTNTSGATSGVFTGLPVGDYTFLVTDANGCSYQELYTIEDVDNILVTGQLESDVNCNPGTDGEVVFTVTHFTGTYSYSINGATAVTGQTNPTVSVTGITAASTQTIVITDETTGCTATASIAVSQPAPLDLILDAMVNANCNSGAEVSVTASGGTGAYTYSFVVSGSPAGTYSSSNTAVLDPAVSTVWDVYVQDANGCVITTPLTITIDTDPIPTGLSVTGSPCISGANDYSFTVNVATGIAPYTYSIGNGFQSSPTFTVTASGTYNITVKDANGCTNTITYTIEDPIGLTLDYAAPSCSDDDGEITVLGFGGTGNYAYAINPSPASVTLTGNVFSGVPSGTYDVTITDTTSNCTKDVTITLDPATPVSFTLAASDVTCNGGSDGIITVTLPASNDNPVYTYEITAPITVAPQTSNIFTGLAVGTYTVQVTSGKNCITTETITVSEPDIIIVSDPIVTQYECASGNAINYATITVNTITGGSGVYPIYEFIENGVVVQSGSSNTYTEADSTGGTFTINVYDDAGCVGSTATAITVTPFINLESLDVNVTTEITCTNLESISVTANTTGGTPTNLEYTLEDVVGATTGGVYSETNTTGNFTGLDIGNYIVTVTNLDTGCSLETVHYVNNPNTFDLIVDSVIDVTCFNDTDGSVNITFVDLVISGTNPDQAGPFTYTITDEAGTAVVTDTAPNAGPITIAGLLGGTYTITATADTNPFCTVVKSFTITRPTAELSVSATEASSVTCDNNIGSIEAIATGGWSTTYEYELLLGGAVVEPYSPNSFFSNLAAGTYTVNVRDTSGCIASADVTLEVPTPINATFIPSSTMLLCFGDQDASITIENVTGGQGSNYTYVLNTIAPTPSSSGPQSSNVFNNLAAGTYSITITDGYNCEFSSANIVIDQPAQIEASLVTTTTQSCAVESTLTLTATGGVAPYTYSDTSTFNTTLGTFNNTITFPVPHGMHQYYVRDANGCEIYVSNEITIDPLEELVVALEASTTTINCSGDNNGSIVASAQGGLGNYVYTLEDTNGNTINATQDSPGVFTGLFAGDYVVHVVSEDCIANSATISITEPSEPLTASFNVSDVTCSGSNNGILEIIASGGTGIIKYAISPQLNQFFETNVFENLAPGDYTVIVQDVLGCYITFDFTITEPIPVTLDITPNSIFAELCAGEGDGEFSVDIAGGSLPYSVSLDDSEGVYTTGGSTQTLFEFTGLSGGDHIVYVRDAEGCESEWYIPFPEAVTINPTVEVEFSCVGNSLTNTVTVYVDDSNTDTSLLEYALDGGPYQASNVFTNVPAGTNHYIDVKHDNGCIQNTDFFVVQNYQPLSLILNEGSEPGEIVATATGGTGDYEFSINNGTYGSNNSFMVTQTGTYYVTVIDSAGCLAEAAIEINIVGPCMSNYFTPNNDGIADTWAPGCAEDFPNLTFDIFDRYGRKVATLQVGEYWDGTYNGTELPTGDYWYVVKTNSQLLDKEYVGHFTLYR
ncbi:T9SS type B sorting domain-containing protein [Bizionia paragorgiae]|uniref:Gliding motility-associated C-terminal domain-containing protein n=1 Tax=Bizionia paragorgiae TaxID=283786 RepID=A0A1H4AF74_BIZPA|nr:T9SS type B sorting domain-containing protein [Bizionia paragorgiae]SEA34212.1 gliding motility-associated C-terminal domain-containing protein [Bizionia paragorgiae]